MNASAETWHLDNQTVQVTHLEKVYWSQTGFTKREVLEYYRQIAPILLPYLKDRPVTLRMYPQGIEETSYYLRDCPVDAPEWLGRVMYQPKTVNHTVPLPLIDTAADLLLFANQGAIEVHLWGSRSKEITQPDLAIFDLDAGSNASFDAVQEAALRLHDALEKQESRGIPRPAGEAECTSLCHSHPVPRSNASADGSKRWGKSWRRTIQISLLPPAVGPDVRSRVTVDYAQNSLGRNTAAPYTLRAHPEHPTVSTPLTWEELGAGTIRPATFTPLVVLERVSRMGDLSPQSCRRISASPKCEHYA